MIGRLTGRLAAKHPPQVLVDVAGVGYELDGKRVDTSTRLEEGQKIRVPLQPTGGSGPIKASGLQARINGNPAVVTRLQAPGDDMIILLVFDVTGDLALTFRRL